MPTKKVADVSKPGSTPADTTSKPVIVGHKSMVADPMVNTDDKKAEDSAKPAQQESTQNKNIQPVSDEFKKPQEEAAKAPESETQPPAEEAKKSQAAEPEAPEKEDAKEITEENQAKAPGEEDERQTKLKELIENKKYNVTFKNPEKGSAKTFFVTVFVVILIGIVVFALLDDAGIIDLGVNLPFDFIK